VVDAAVVVIEPVASRISVANAPWTYGAFEITLDDPNVPGALDVLDMVAAAGYSGWLVVEQNTLPDPACQLERTAADQVASRDYLRQRGI
jgi:hypothetical protein